MHKAIGYMMLVWSSASYGQLTLNYIELTKEYHPQLSNFEQTNLLQLGFKTDAFNGYLEFKNEQKHSSYLLAEQKLKITVNDKNLAIKLKTKGSRNFSKVSVIHTATFFPTFISKFKTEIQYKADNNQINLLFSPIARWSMKFGKHTSAISLKPIFLILPHPRQNNKGHYMKETSLEWSYQSQLRHNLMTHLKAELKHKHIHRITEKKLTFSIKYDL